MNPSFYSQGDSSEYGAEAIAQQAIFIASTSSKNNNYSTDTVRIVRAQPAVSMSFGQPSVKQMPAPEARPGNVEHNDNMTPATKDLLDARLETIEVRIDARMGRIEELIGDTRREIDLMRQESKADNKSTRATMIVTGISSVFAIVLGIAAFNATVLSNMVASFESGKNTASAQAASEKALIEATKALEAATEKAKQATSNPAPPAPTGQPQQ